MTVVSPLQVVLTHPLAQLLERPLRNGHNLSTDRHRGLQYSQVGKYQMEVLLQWQSLEAFNNKTFSHQNQWLPKQAKQQTVILTVHRLICNFLQYLWNSDGLRVVACLLDLPISKLWSRNKRKESLISKALYKIRGSTYSRWSRIGFENWEKNSTRLRINLAQL
jgi:hypothetical protein